jgi:hypothetical protein
MNEIHDTTRTGTIGELFVQLRLLEYGVQAAPPLKHSGNDLIAVKDTSFRAIQIKTTTTERFKKRGLPERYHRLAVVHLAKPDSSEVSYDQSTFFLLSKLQVEHASCQISGLSEYKISQNLLNSLFSESEHGS